MKTKVCKTCEEEKPLTAFHKNKGSRDGRRTECKECRKNFRTDNRGREYKIQEFQPYKLPLHKVALGI